MANYQSTHTGQEHDAYCTKSQLINLVYPVGSIYMSINSTSPQTLFGGTWQQISDTFLLCAGSTYTAGSTGGEATHQLVNNELPKLSGTARMGWNDGSAAGIMIGSVSGIFGATSGTAYFVRSSTSGTYSTNLTINFGNDQPHNNMPPYLAVYVWKRTA